MSHSDSKDQRAATRFDTAMPVEIDGLAGRTHNVSASGVYFETDVRHQVGDRVNFTVELVQGGRKRLLRCEGEVVRVDAEGQRMGVAARLAEPFFGETEVVEIASASGPA